MVAVLPHALRAQPSLWNSYNGSTSLFVPYSGYDSVLGNDKFPGSPQLDVTVSNVNGSGSGTRLDRATMDTGSTGVVISLTQACTGGVLACTGSNPANYRPASSSVIGYSTVTYSSSGVSYDGFYADAQVKITSSGTTQATSTVPVFIAVSKHCDGCTQSHDPAPSAAMFGIGFGRTANATGLKLNDANGAPNGVVLYGKTLNPLLNLTSLNMGGTLTSNISSIAPGYVVTSRGVYLGLSSSVVGSAGPFVSLAVIPQTASPSNVSAYATHATVNDWQTPPMLMTVTQNGFATPINGRFYGTMLVDTGISDAILTTGTTTGQNGAPTLN